MASFSSDPATQAFPPFSTQRLMYKNDLQEFAQGSNIALPLYQTVNEGQDHAPQFRSTVSVDGTCYTSQQTFPQRKAAEQEAARLALKCLMQTTTDKGSQHTFPQRKAAEQEAARLPLKCLMQTTTDKGSQHTFPQRKAAEQEAARLTLESFITYEGYSFVLENATCKSILNEYAAKMNLQRPTYNTVWKEGLGSDFISSLVFNGVSYTGDAARRKQEAEQLGARAAILSILGDSDSGTTLFQTIKSKSKFYDAVKGNGMQTIYASGVSPVANTTTAPTSVTMDHKDKEVADPVGDNGSKVEFPECCKMLSTCQQSQMLTQGSAAEATEPATVPPQPGTTHPIDDGSSSKKGRRNIKLRRNRKANKKSRLETRYH